MRAAVRAVSSSPPQPPHPVASEVTPEGRKATKRDTILLNGNNACIVSRVAAGPCGRVGALAHPSRRKQLVPGGVPSGEEEDVTVRE